MSAAREHWHVPALDGLRGVAVLTVLMAHASVFRLAGGNIGVDLFFVLSGFLITSILLNEWRERGEISIWRFYLRRVLRLLPAAYSVAVFVLLFTAFAAPDLLPSSWWDALTVGVYGFNWRLVWLYTHDAVGAQNHMLSHYWSLSVEEQFYIVWPILLLILMRIKASRAAMLSVFSIAILAPAIGRALLWQQGPSLELYFRTDLRIDGLAWGAALAWLLYQKILPTGNKATLYAAIVAPVSFAIYAYLSRGDLLSTGEMYRGGFTIVAIASAAMVWSAATNKTSLFTRMLEFRWLRWTGTISYGLYLWHVPMFEICNRLPINDVWRLILALVLTFLVASVSFKFYETPFLNLKRRIGYAQSARSSNPPREDGPINLLRVRRET